MLHAGRGARPRGRERRGQVDADEDPGRRLPARQRHHRARRQRGVLRPPGPGAAGRRLDGVPGVQPAARADDRRERLPRPRAAHASASSTPAACTATPTSCSTASASPSLKRHARACAQLSVAEQQVVEIAKAVSFDAKVIQMDEPTAALADHEVELLYSIIERLTARGVAILYVSHRLKEIFDLCDTITDPQGRPPGQQRTGRRARRGLAGAADGRPPALVVLPRQAPRAPRSARSRLDARGRRQRRTSTASTSTLRAGEIVGLAGLQGSGRTELRRGGLRRPAVRPAARWRSTASAVTVRSPRQGVRAGLALVTEDRKATGLALNQSILDNALGVVRAVLPVAGPAPRAARCPACSRASRSRPAALDQEVQFLSGGNQQKVVLARWLSIEPARRADGRAHPRHRRRRQARDLRADARAGRRGRRGPDGLQRAARGHRHVRPHPGDARRPARRRAARRVRPRSRCWRWPPAPRPRTVRHEHRHRHAAHEGARRGRRRTARSPRRSSSTSCCCSDRRRVGDPHARPRAATSSARATSGRSSPP